MNTTVEYNDDECGDDAPQGLDEFTDLLEQVSQATEEGRSEDALGLMAGIMAMMAERAENEVPDLHRAIRCEAHEREASADWVGAEAAYRRALDISGDSAHQKWINHGSLRSLYMFLGRTEDALEEARAAVDAGREALEMLHAQALVSQAVVHLHLGQAWEACDLVTEALPLFSTSELAASQRAQALAVRARCFVELEDEEAARTDLDASWAVLEPRFAMAALPSVQGAIGAWWQAEAGLRRRQGDLDGCVKAWREVMLSRRWNAGQPQLTGPYVQSSLAEALESLAHAQEMAGDPVAAAESIAESRSIRQEIEHPRP